jgi:hypothetical protein
METIGIKNPVEQERWRAKGEGVYGALTMTPDDPAFGNFLWYVAQRRIEEEAETYVAFAARAIGRDVQEFFSGMADLKYREAEKLQENAENGCRIAEDIEEGLAQTCVQRSGVEGEVIGSMEAACRLALRFEVANYCLHIRLAELEENGATRGLFLFLVGIHKANLQFIEKTLHEATQAVPPLRAAAAGHRSATP